MKSVKSVVIFLTLAFSTLVASAQNLTTTVEVINVVPHIEVVNTQRENCDRVSQQPVRKSGNPLVTALSTIAGAGLGNQIGDGNGKTIATVVGGIAGYSAATSSNDGYYQPSCYVENIPVQRQNGFDVTYLFLGRQLTMFTQVHPGNRMQINVTVSPTLSNSRW